jgi:hypothetical protein
VKNQNQWYCGAEGQQFGPFTWEQMRAMAVEGRLIADSPVRRDVDQKWFQASQIPGLLPKAHGGSAIGKAATGSAVKTKPAMKKAVALAPAAGAKASDSTIIAPRDTPTVKGLPRVKPAAVPAGSVPVGTVPKGHAVAAPPAPPPQAHEAFAFVAPSAAGATATKAPAKKSSATKVAVIALSGVVALVGLAGGGLVVWKYTRPAAGQVATNDLAAVQQELQTSLEAAVGDLEGNPLASIPIEPTATAADAPATSARTASPDKNSAGAEAKLITTMAGWTNVNSIKYIGLNKVKLRVDSAWLAADDSGARADLTPTGDVPASAKYVFVKLEIINTAPVARSYVSWNASAGTSVVMADQGNQVLALLPVSQTPRAERLTKLDIQPGQTVYDVLVFAAPQGKVEKLKLALEKATLAEGMKVRAPTHFALEIPLETLLTQSSGSGNVVAAALDPVLANQAAEGEPAGAPAIVAQPSAPLEVSPTAPAAAADGDKPVANGYNPPSAEELNRLFEELSEKYGDPAEKSRMEMLNDKGKEPEKKPGKPKT